MSRAEGRAAVRWRAAWRRTAFFGLTFLTSAAAAALLLDILEANGISRIELCGVALFFILFTWIAGSFWTAVAGFVVRLVGRDPAAIDPADVAGRPLHTRIAITMPVYNEDPQRVEAGLEATWVSLQAESEHASFDLFILSDTTNVEIASAEEAMWRNLVARHRADGRIFYRRRLERSERKAGNILEFVRRWGASYECMVVLDADSVMSGGTLVTLARLMEAHPEIGILQSLPLAAGRESLFGRLLQFGARLQSPLLSTGLAYWQLGESNYYGHNAIVRIEPFGRYCTLPRLSGRPPLGGEILSHDFVEAAFMRRGGYEVRQLPQLFGSWEEVPANVIDFAVRDRRWTQGNLQHSRVMLFRGLHPLSRIHLLTGIVSYLSSPVWFALLLLSSVLSAMEAAKKPQYFLPGFVSLFPHWPQIRGGETAVLLAATLAVLLLPKVFGALLAIRDRRVRGEFGGSARLLLSLLIEQFFSMLLAPSMMLFHSTFVVQTLAGKSVSWNAQDRSERGLTVREALRRQKWHLVLGVVWGASMAWLAPQFFWWLTPVLAGLISCVWLTVWTSRPSAGLRLQRSGLLLTPEETAPPPELVALKRGCAQALPPTAAKISGTSSLNGTSVKGTSSVHGAPEAEGAPSTNGTASEAAAASEAAGAARVPAANNGHDYH
ncbi:MAG: glucans biosynthesis glucosyltransferase MdoH, partial [Gammaproteobacteria bacterium]|nr:glucans biosynthesis glucosyltransferase MdoH [Gammaproteobacteria bacterium]